MSNEEKERPPVGRVLRQYAQAFGPVGAATDGETIRELTRLIEPQTIATRIAVASVLREMLRIGRLVQ